MATSYSQGCVDKLKRVLRSLPRTAIQRQGRDQPMQSPLYRHELLALIKKRGAYAPLAVYSEATVLKSFANCVKTPRGRPFHGRTRK